MNHLKVNEIIEFVSLNELNAETVEFCAYVNGHVRKCEECRQLVDAFQTVYDEFCRIGNSKNFEEYINARYFSEEKSVTQVLKEMEK